MLTTSIRDRNIIVERLFLEKGPMLRGMASQWVPAQRIEDSIQDTMAKCLKYFDKFDPTRNIAFSTWAVTILRNTCFDYSRRKDRVRELHIDSLEESTKDEIYKNGNLYAPANDYSAMEDTTVNNKNVKDCLESLPPMHREILEERYFHGGTKDKYMANHNITWPAYRTRLKRARTSFRKNFQGVIR